MCDQYKKDFFLLFVLLREQELLDFERDVERCRSFGDEQAQ